MTRKPLQHVHIIYACQDIQHHLSLEKLNFVTQPGLVDARPTPTVSTAVPLNPSHELHTINFRGCLAQKVCLGILYIPGQCQWHGQLQVFIVVIPISVQSKCCSIGGGCSSPTGAISTPQESRKHCRVQPKLMSGVCTYVTLYIWTHQNMPLFCKPGANAPLSTQW